jgi:hypothetical protein
MKGHRGERAGGKSYERKKYGHQKIVLSEELNDVYSRF